MDYFNSEELKENAEEVKFSPETNSSKKSPHHLYVMESAAQQISLSPAVST